MSFETNKVKNDIERLEQNLKTLENNLYGYGTPGYNMNKYKTTSSRYIKAKAEFDKEFPKYEANKKELERQLSALKTKLNTIQTKEEVDKKTKKAKEQIGEAKDEIQRAKDARDTEAQKVAEEKLKAARIERNQAEAAPKGEAEEDTVLEEDGNIYADYTVDAKGNVTNKEGKTVVFVESKNKQGDILPKEYTSSASARDAFLKNYSQPGQLDQLKKDLVASGYLKDSEKNTPNWIGAVDDLIIAHTRKSVVDVKYGGLKQPVTIDLFMKEKKAGAGTGGGTKTYREYSSRGDASRMLDGYFNDLLGYGATPEEEDAFYKELRAAEDKAFRTVTDGRTGVGGFLEDADRLLLAAKVAKKNLKNTDVDMLLNSRQGSQVAIDIADLQAKANAYGIDMPASEALKYVVAGVGQKDYIEKQEQRLRQLSMTMHPYLKDHIAAGGTVKEVADEYARTKANKLGIVVTNATKDKDIMSAVASGKSVVDFERELQMDPLWRKTPEARKVANDFANTMIQTFGLG
jgi:hypothetical protein